MSRPRPKRERYITFPNKCLVSDNFASLSPFATKLIFDFAAKCYGYNNGDLNMVWPEMKARGWRSKDTLYKARDEIVEKGWIIQTRQGWNNRCALYGFTFLSIGEFGGRKLDLVKEGTPATNAWQLWKPER